MGKGCLKSIFYFGWAWVMWSQGAQAAWGQIEALAGQPFGVAEVTVAYTPLDSALTYDSSSFSVTSPDHRVAYPAFDGFRRRLRLVNGPATGQLTVMFLFRGSEPFDVTICTPIPQTIHVVPGSARNDNVRDRLLRRWWRTYSAFLRDQAADSDYPPIAETYLSAMLSRRLGQTTPLLDRLRENAPGSTGTSTGDDTAAQTLKLLAGAEELRMATLRNSSLGLRTDTDMGTLPMPPAPAWRQLTFGPLPQEPTVEPMAMRVPRECFYVRFGQYANYLWLNALMEDYGGDLRTMFSARGMRAAVNERAQDQLAMRSGLLAELLGPQAIADVAMIGMDTFTREGAAVGAVFEAKNGLLEVDLTRQRQEALFREQNRGATITTEKIGDRDVSFLSTPDNRLRSYYLVDGNYHLVTNSRRIVERFLEVREGTDSLGASEEFRSARLSIPTSRDDTIFVYFSSAFFENLLSPAYQIELNRRLQAATDLELITLAGLAARNEGLPGESLDELVAAGLLPRGFGQRADGSGPIEAQSGLLDSLRGARGFFLPVPDVRIDGISAAEQARYAAQSAYYAEHWKQMDPLLIAIKRFSLPDAGRERVTIDALISPLDETKYGWYLALLGEPTRFHLSPPTGSLVSAEAALRGGLIFPGIPAHTLFVGVQDRDTLPVPQRIDGPRMLEIIRSLPAYLGAWPKPGFLDVLPLGLGGRPGADGFTQLLLGIWRWQGRGFSVLSMERNILEDVDRQIGFLEEDDLAQVRIQVGDLSAAKFRTWIDARSFTRAGQISQGNAQFLGILTQQLGVPQADALTTGEALLDALLKCPLRGEYHLTGDEGAQTWTSTQLPPAGARTKMPDGYTAPPLEWFRGLEARLLRTPERIVLRAHVDMQRKEREPLLNLPLFDSRKKAAESETPDSGGP